DRRIRRRVDERQLSLALPSRQIPVEASHVLADVVGGLLEGDEDAGLPPVSDPRREELHREYRLPATSGSGDQRGAVLGQPALGDHVEARDACGQLWHRLEASLVRDVDHAMAWMESWGPASPRGRAGLCPCRTGRQ